MHIVIIIQILAEYLLAMLIFIVMSAFITIDTSNVSNNYREENGIHTLQQPQVLTIEYPKILITEYPKADDIDDQQRINNATKKEIIKEQSSNDYVASSTLKQDDSLSEKKYDSKTNILIGNKPINTSKSSEVTVKHREELDEYDRFLLQISSSLF